MLLPATGDVIELELEAPKGQVITYSLPNLISALGVDDPSRIAVETDGLRKALVTIYPSNPLADMRAVTLDDLVMDRRGYITVGRYHNGRPVQYRLFDPRSGSAQRFLCFGTTGAGKSRVLQMLLIAEKVNRIVSFTCDLKMGQSVPEARGNVDWFGYQAEVAILMLQSAVRIARERMERYSRMGRTAFLVGRPDPLLHVSIEEANRLLEKGAPYREQAAYLILELGRTGRSVGVGIRLNAQASHLEELGGSDTLRAMLKEGQVTLLRWSSSMMKQLVADGLLPQGVQLMPIPRLLAPTRLTSQFDVVDDDEEDAETQGTAYLLSGKHPASMMRHWRVGSIEPLPGLDPEILALYGDGDPARLEEASHAAAGDAYRWRDDEAVMAEMCAAVETDADLAARQRGGTASASDGGDGTGGGGGGGRATAEDRVLAVLVTAGGTPLTPEQVHAEVNADGGRDLRIGTIRNALSGLAETAVIIRSDRGQYAATP